MAVEGYRGKYRTNPSTLVVGSSNNGYGAATTLPTQLGSLEHRHSRRPHIATYLQQINASTSLPSLIPSSGKDNTIMTIDENNTTATEEGTSSTATADSDAIQELQWKNVDLGRQMVLQLQTLLDQVGEAEEQVQQVRAREHELKDTTQHYKEMAQVLMERVKEDDHDRFRLKKKIDTQLQTLEAEKQSVVQQNEEAIEQLHHNIELKEQERVSKQRKSKRVQALIRSEQVAQMENFVETSITTNLTPGQATSEGITAQALVTMFSSNVYNQTSDEATHQFMYSQRRNLGEFLDQLAGNSNTTADKVIPGEYQRVATPAVHDIPGIEGSSPPPVIHDNPKIVQPTTSDTHLLPELYEEVGTPSAVSMASDLQDGPTPAAQPEEVLKFGEENDDNSSLCSL